MSKWLNEKPAMLDPKGLMFGDGERVTRLYYTAVVIIIMKKIPWHGY